MFGTPRVRMLDAMSGLWCVNVGYGRKELADAAHQQMMTLPFYNSFFQTTNVPAVKLAAKLASLAPKVDGRSFEHVFFSSSGSESNDSNVRMVRRYWDLLGQPQRKVIIGRQERLPRQHHGRCLAGRHEWHACAGRPADSQHHPHRPALLFENGKPGESADEFGVRAAGWLEEKILAIGAGQGGRVHCRAGAGSGWRDHSAGHLLARDSAHRRQIRHLADQRRGDLCLWPPGALVCLRKIWLQARPGDLCQGGDQRLYPAWAGDGGGSCGQSADRERGEFNHGYTYSGHPVACAVALANLDIMEAEQLPQRVRGEAGAYFARRYAELNDHPLVGQAETCGFVAGLVLVKNKQTKERFKESDAVGMVCRGHCFRNGLIMRAVGDRMIIAPPLTLTHSEVDELMRLIRQALDLTLQDLQAKGLL
jgi:putrescine aminotransferase